MQVRLISYTVPCTDLQQEGLQSAEDVIIHNARVSNPANQLNVDTGARLIKYCVDHQHWSIFEQAFMTVEIKTSRAVASQILRHRSFTFQEFSQRYSVAHDIEHYELRRQAEKNRQSSSDVIWDNENGVFDVAANAINVAHEAYSKLIELGVARESARMILPLTTQTTMYMSGSCRSFMHYVDLRTKEDTQKEHREIAHAVRDVFKQVFPMVSAAKNY